MTTFLFLAGCTLAFALTGIYCFLRWQAAHWVIYLLIGLSCLYLCAIFILFPFMQSFFALS